MDNFSDIRINPLSEAVNFSGFQITQSMMWDFFSLFFIVYVFITLIFVYHWQRYETPGSLLFWGQVVYFVGSLLLLITAGMAVSAY